MILNKDFKEFITSLNDNRVCCLVVCGYAIAVHGHPRYTKDMDVWIDLLPENTEQVIIKAHDQFRFGALEPTPDDFLTPSLVIQLGITAEPDRSAYIL